MCGIIAVLRRPSGRAVPGSDDVLAPLIAAVDLFVFWRVCLTAIGIAVIGNMPTRKAAIGVFALWIIMIFIQAGFGILGQKFGAGFNPGG